MRNVEHLSRVSIAARHLRVRPSGRPTLPASQRPRNTKSPCIQAPKRYVAALDPHLISLIGVQGSRPDKGRQTNSTPKTMNAPGKYHQSSGNQSGWSHHQNTRNCASGANSTPLGSPLRMSPVDSSAVEPSLSSAKAVVVCLFLHQTALA